MTSREIAFTIFNSKTIIELYRDRRDLLRFNQFFNIYMQAEHVDPEVLKPYRDIIEALKLDFHVMYSRAEEDHTLRTDEPEEEMLSTILLLLE